MRGWIFLCLAACGVAPTTEPAKPSPQPIKSSRIAAKLTVNSGDWDRLWAKPAEMAPPPMMPMPMGPPPKEATDACAQKAQGASCAFTHDGHALSGTCGKTPQGQAVCMPQMMMMAPPMPPVIGGTLAGVTSTPVLVKVTPGDDDRVTLTSTEVTLEPADSAEGGIDLSIDHGNGFEGAGWYRRRVNP